MKCLLIETVDNRKFLTHEKNFIQLIEFAKVFNAKISKVTVKEGEILDLEELASAICNPNHKNKLEYKITEEIKTKNRTRNEILMIANKVKEHILSEFKNHNTLSIKDLKNKFQKYNLSTAALNNYFNQVKKELEKEGYSIKKISIGAYKIV